MKNKDKDKDKNINNNNVNIKTNNKILKLEDYHHDKIIQNR
jgi:hypothetical protein